MRFAIGESSLELTVLGAGFHGAAPDGAGWPDGPPPDVASWELDANELVDLEAFMEAGWNFWRQPDLPWRDRQESLGRPIRPGLLARSEAGGLVVIRDRLVVGFDSGESAARLLERFSDAKRVPYGDELHEVTIPLPERDLLQAVKDQLRRLRTDAEGGEWVRFAEPSLLYHLVWTGEIEARKGAPQWHWEKIKLKDAWREADRKGGGVRVAVIDFGFDEPGNELGGRIEWVAHLDADGCEVGARLPRDGHGTRCAAA